MEWVWTAVVLGILGSAHCVGMCGPLLWAVAAGERGSSGSIWAGRLTYHLGRISVYAVMGAIFGVFGQTLALAGLQQGATVLLGVTLLGGLIFSWWPRLAGAAGVRWGGVRRWMGPLLHRRDGPALFGLGALNGLLPCGLVYTAAVGAAATGAAGAGLVYMLAFGFATWPATLMMQHSQTWLPVSWRGRLRHAVPAGVALLGGLLVLRGLGLGIPWISPRMTEPTACCHSVVEEAAAVGVRPAHGGGF